LDNFIVKDYKIACKNLLILLASMKMNVQFKFNGSAVLEASCSFMFVCTRLISIRLLHDPYASAKIRKKRNSCATGVPC